MKKQTFKKLLGVLIFAISVILVSIGLNLGYIFYQQKKDTKTAKRTITTAELLDLDLNLENEDAYEKREEQFETLNLLLMQTNTYIKAERELIAGKREITPIYDYVGDEKIIVEYKVSHKIYIAKEYFEKSKREIEKIKTPNEKIKNLKEKFLTALDYRIEGVDLLSKSLYTKAIDYKGEGGKGTWERKNRK